MSDQADFPEQFKQLMGQLQDVQSRAREMESKAAEVTGEGQAGGGMVKAVANARMEVLKVRLDPDLADLDDLEMLEDLVVAAVNQALKAARETFAQEVAGGMGLPFMGR